jgi:hypothetical protein
LGFAIEFPAPAEGCGIGAPTYFGGPYIDIS